MKKGLKLFNSIVFVFVAVVCAAFAPYVDAETIPEVTSFDQLSVFATTGGSLKLSDDVTMTGNLTVTKDLVIDLNGHTLDNGGKSLLVLSDLTFKDTSVSESGKFVDSTNGSAWWFKVGDSTHDANLVLESGLFSFKRGINVLYNSSFTMNDGKIENLGSSNSVRLENNANFTMNGGEIVAHDGIGVAALTSGEVIINDGKITAMWYAIVGNGSYTGAKFTVNGGTLIGEDSPAIYAPQIDGVTIIKGGKFIGDESAIEIRAGRLDISDGTFIGNTVKYVVESNPDGTTHKGAAIAIAQHTTKQPIEVNISGGKFTGVVPISEVNLEHNAPEDVAKIKIDVTGGTFNSTVGDYVIISEDVKNFVRGGTFNGDVSKYMKEHYVLKKDSEELYSVHKVLFDEAVTLSKDSYVYTGAYKKPVVTVVFDENTLVKDKDYTVTYKNNLNAGTATVVVKGIGSYEGVITKTFVIEKQSNFTVSDFVNKIYNKEAQTQSIVVKYGKKTLVKDKDYTVTYKNNKYIGTATVTITGKGNYTGKVVKTFKINPVKIAFSSLTAKKKAVKVSYYKPAGNVTYQIAYRNSGTKTWTFVSTSKNSYTIKNLSSKKSYNFRVRAVKKVSGVNYYGAWSTMKTVKVK